MDLVKMSISEFAGELASGNPTPGGGSVGALCGALAAALARMVTELTLGREKFKDAWEDLEFVRARAISLEATCLELVQRDSDAYSEVTRAFKSPKGTEEEKSERSRAIQAAFKGAALVPLQTLRAACEIMDLCMVAMAKGNPNTLSDAGVGAQLARAAAYGAAYNVRVNLTSIKDQTFVTETVAETNELIEKIDAGLTMAGTYLEQQIVSGG